MPDGIDPPSRLPASPPVPVTGERADPRRSGEQRRRDRRKAGRAPATPDPDHGANAEDSSAEGAPDRKGSHIDIVA